MRTPCLAAALLVGAGIAAEEALRPGPRALAALTAAWAAVLALKIASGRRAPRVLVGAGIALVAAFRSATFPPPPAQWPRSAPPDRPVSIRARVITPPERRPGGGIRVDVRAGPDRLAAFIAHPPDGIGPGDLLALDGILRRPRPPRNPGERWRSEPELLDGRTGDLDVPYAPGVAVLARGGGIARILWRAREALRGSIHRAFSPRHRAVMEALLLADRRGLPRTLLADLRATGTIHVIAISGLHVGIVAALALWLLRLARPRPLPELAIVATSILAYAALAAFRPSTVRAAIMASATMAAAALGLRLGPRNALGLAAGAILLANPRALHQVSFQLSVAAVWGILRWGVGGRRGALRGALRVSAGALLGTAPLIAYHFHRFHPASPLWNLAACPLVAAVLVTGLAAALVGLVWTAAAIPLAAAAGAGIDLLSAILGLRRRLPDAVVTVPPFAWGWVIAYYAVAGIPRDRPWIARVARVALALAFLGSMLWPTPPAALVLDAGSGVAVLMRGPGRRMRLVLGGPVRRTLRSIPGAAAALGAARIEEVVALDAAAVGAADTLRRRIAIDAVRREEGAVDLRIGGLRLRVRVGSPRAAVPAGAVLVLGGSAARRAPPADMGRPAWVVLCARAGRGDLERAARSAGAGFLVTGRCGAIRLEPRRGAWRVRPVLAPRPGGR